MRMGQLDADSFVDFSFTNHINRIKQREQKNEKKEMCQRSASAEQPTY